MRAISAFKGFDDLAGLIGTAVVDDYHFALLKVLWQEVLKFLKRCADSLFFVVGWNYN
jgi:hypothetical protein